MIVEVVDTDGFAVVAVDTDGFAVVAVDTDGFVVVVAVDTDGFVVVVAVDTDGFVVVAVDTDGFVFVLALYLASNMALESAAILVELLALLLLYCSNTVYLLFKDAVDPVREANKVFNLSNSYFIVEVLSLILVAESRAFIYLLNLSGVRLALYSAYNCF